MTCFLYMHKLRFFTTNAHARAARNTNKSWTNITEDNTGFSCKKTILRKETKSAIGIKTARGKWQSFLQQIVQLWKYQNNEC